MNRQEQIRNLLARIDADPAVRASRWLDRNYTQYIPAEVRRDYSDGLNRMIRDFADWLKKNEPS